MSRFFLDTEFVDTGREIILLSVGVVREHGPSYYAEVANAPVEQADQFVRSVVLPQLTRFSRPPQQWGATVKTRDEIAQDLTEFMGEEPEVWAYIDHYDWVALSQLFGPLTRRPETWPWSSWNIAMLWNLARMHGEPTDLVPAPPDQHHALADAHWDRDLFAAIQRYCKGEPELAALVAW